MIALLLQCADGIASLCELVALAKQLAQWSKAVVDASNEIRPNNSLIWGSNLFCLDFSTKEQYIQIASASSLELF